METLYSTITTGATYNCTGIGPVAFTKSDQTANLCIGISYLVHAFMHIIAFMPHMIPNSDFPIKNFLLIRVVGNVGDILNLFLISISSAFYSIRYTAFCSDPFGQTVISSLSMAITAHSNAIGLLLCGNVIILSYDSILYENIFKQKRIFVWFSLIWAFIGYYLMFIPTGHYSPTKNAWQLSPFNSADVDLTSRSINIFYLFYNLLVLVCYIILLFFRCCTIFLIDEEEEPTRTSHNDPNNQVPRIMQSHGHLNYQRSAMLQIKIVAFIFVISGGLYVAGIVYELPNAFYVFATHLWILYHGCHAWIYLYTLESTKHNLKKLRKYIYPKRNQPVPR
uniref:G_PROTEIN_RECEP_F1_2 domain-containing protein n=1 Tax=Rhabditophanes sp. KR3021 TaxID=114890 RepID=A0AC35UBV1_9BILA